jgi:hypothetical protein
MLQGLTREEFRKTVFSVGDAHRTDRPLSPVEVATVFHKALKAGSSRKEIAGAFQLDSAMVARFLRLTELAPEIHHLIDWGKSKESAIGFSTASELCRAPRGDHDELAAAILKHGASKEETTSIIQLRERSGDSLGACISRVISRRPSVRVFQVVLGAVTAASLQQRLASLPQAERDKALRSVMRRLYPKMQTYSAKLGDVRFTVVGEQAVTENLAKDPAFESHVNTALEAALANMPDPSKGSR